MHDDLVSSYLLWWKITKGTIIFVNCLCTIIVAQDALNIEFAQVAIVCVSNVWREQDQIFCTILLHLAILVHFIQFSD